jgi:hypothetical protein
MCDKCLKRAIGREIVDVQLKLDRVFAKLEKDPSLKSDAEFIRLADCMHDLLGKYNLYPKE